MAIHRRGEEPATSQGQYVVSNGDNSFSDDEIPRRIQYVNLQSAETKGRRWGYASWRKGSHEETGGVRGMLEDYLGGQ